MIFILIFNDNNFYILLFNSLCMTEYNCDVYLITEKIVDNEGDNGFSSYLGIGQSGLREDDIEPCRSGEIVSVKFVGKMQGSKELGDYLDGHDNRVVVRRIFKRIF
jgi:hypothetical protein